MTTPTSRYHPFPPPAAPRARAGTPARDARPPGARTATRRRALVRTPALATALWGALVLGVDATQARTPHPHKAASAPPSTEQILAPSAATVPDALPTDRQVWRCGSSYSARPCAADPAANPLDVADARSDAQRRQSEELTARDKRLAAWYEAGRRQRETPASAPTQPARTAAIAPACVDTTTMHCVPKKPGTRKVTSGTASSPALGRRRK
ncbi:MAG TPA: hypothetical protein VIP05_18870 [Burkholderiaceae bacterium]